MRQWEHLLTTDTFQALIDKFNVNANSSKYIEELTGSILCNGVIFNGNETIDGKLIRPLSCVELSGQVSSDTIFDNFTLYFRDTNNTINVERFPVDLLNYADGKPHFLYFKEDLTYVVSDYMFGKADEVIIGRFIINSDSTWNQFYIMSQRAGTPMYHAADEFYEVSGVYTKSPEGLKLSHSIGTVKRSGIDFTDRISPDIVDIVKDETSSIPLRYINTFNEVDYSQNTTNDVITNKYMIYNMNKNLKLDADNLISKLKNMYYELDIRANKTATELHDSIIAGGDYIDLKQIVDTYVASIDLIYAQVDSLYTILSNPALSSVNKSLLTENKELMENFLDEYLRGIAISIDITEIQVTAIRNSVHYILSTNLLVCNIPLDIQLDTISEELNDITFDAGTLMDVPEGKITVQRVLWDIYEDTFIMQYGNQIFDTFDAAIQGTEIMSFPAPFNKTIYIPIAILVIKSGIEDINSDADSLLIDRRWIDADKVTYTYTDYIARSKADKALTQITELLSGNIAIGRANTLKYIDEAGDTKYESGNFYLNYDNLTGAVKVINNLTSNVYSNKQALSAYQGYLLNNNKVSKSGDTMTGSLNSMSIIPKTTDIYELGSESNYWNSIYTNSIYKSSISNAYVYSTGSSILDARAISKSGVTDSYWNALPNKTVLICW